MEWVGEWALKTQHGKDNHRPWVDNVQGSGHQCGAILVGQVVIGGLSIRVVRD